MDTNMPDSSPFLEGWSKLPTELKLEILRYALPSGETLDFAHFSKHLKRIEPKSMRERAQRLRIFDINILPLLAYPAIG
jgi:hypothetical protein